ncbi:hypothetical protein IPG36_08065 [bacterium]|nr:MAG: hypothetical protein IPG36_08065 [bacterium]
MDSASQVESVVGFGILLFFALLVTIMTIVLIVAEWKMFAKAGRPGWHVLVPILNSYDLVKMSGHSGWWLLLMFVPIVNIYAVIVVCLDLAKAFGRSSTFGLFGLVLFSAIGFMILGFGSDKYVGISAPAPTI